MRTKKRMFPRIHPKHKTSLTVNQTDNLQTDWRTLVSDVLVVQVVEVTRSALVEDIAVTQGQENRLE